MYTSIACALFGEASLPFQAGQGFSKKYLWQESDDSKKWLIPKRMITDQYLAKLLAYDKTKYWFTLHDFIATGDFNRDGIQDYIVTASHLEKTFKKTLAPQGNSLCEVDKKVGTCVSADQSLHRNYRIILGRADNGRAEGKESYWGNYFLEDNLPFYQGGVAQPLVADFNGDGWDDVYLAASVADFGKGCGGYHSYFLSQQETLLKESSRSHIEGHDYDNKFKRICNFTHRGDAGDFDKDGDIDIVLSSIDWVKNDGELICLWNNGKGKLTSKVCGDKWGFIVRHGDFNNDGYIDFLVGGHTSECYEFHDNWIGHHSKSKRRHRLVILWGNGTQRWSDTNSKEIRSVGYHQKTSSKVPLCMPVGVFIGDIDNDGDNDFVGSTIGLNYAGGYLISYLNDGIGNFEIKQQIPIKEVEGLRKQNWPMSEVNHDFNGWYLSLHPIDLNFDGKIDFMVNGHFMNPGNSDIYINRGKGQFFRADIDFIRRFGKTF